MFNYTVENQADTSIIEVNVPEIRPCLFNDMMH